jgi:hypothetical protein
METSTWAPLVEACVEAASSWGGRPTPRLPTAPAGCMSVTRGQVRYKGECPLQEGMFVTRGHVNYKGAFPLQGGMSVTRGRSVTRGQVRCTRACPLQEDMSITRRHVRYKGARPLQGACPLQWSRFVTSGMSVKGGRFVTTTLPWQHCPLCRNCGSLQ